MTTYAKDFSDELTTGVFPSDFTARYSSMSDWTVEAPTDAEDNRSFQSDGTGSGIQMASWDDIDGDANRDNCEILARWKHTSDVSNTLWLFGRASGSATSEDCYVFTIRSTGNISIFRYDSGTFNDITDSNINADSLASPVTIFTSDADPSFTHHPTGLWSYARFRINGTGATVTLRGKYWIDGISMVNEPDWWMVEADDTDANRITAAGWVGVGRAGHTGTVDVDYFSVGTNGDTAPLNASTNTTVRVSTIYAEVLGQEANPNTQMSQHFTEVLGQATSPIMRVSGSYMKVLHKNNLSSGTGGGGQLIVTT